MSDYFPQEIWLEILHRLNPKSLVKCTCVCKSWKSIITHQSFICDHLTRTLQHDSSLFIHLHRHNKYEEFYSIYSDSDQIHHLSISKFPLHRIFPSTYLRVIGNCNGLLCLADEPAIDGATQIICNPSIRKYVVLPKPTLLFNKRTVLFGFGFDSKNKDFKVIRLMNFSSQQYTLAIYSLASNCWRIITNKTPPFLVSKLSWESSQMSVNSVLHWVVSRESDNGQIQNFILTFDVVEETFGELMLPQILKESPFVNVSIFEGGDNSQLVVVLRKYSAEFYGIDFSIWVMKEYGVVESWTELLSFDSRRWGSTSLRLLALRNSGEVVLDSWSDEIIVVDPMREKSQKYLRLEGYYHAFVSSHVESLFLMNQVCGDVLSF